MERISSRANAVVKRFRAAVRSPIEVLVLDGAHLLEEALTSGLTVRQVAIHDRLVDGPLGDLAKRAEQRGARVVLVNDQVLAAMSPVRQPAGVVALVDRPSSSLAAALEQAPQLVLILAGIQDPGNVGAVVRAADACGASAIVATEGTADAFGWKALRGSMGSAFHLPVVTQTLLSEATAAARARGLQVLATVPRGGTPLARTDLRRPTAVVFGSEGAGLSALQSASADSRLSIPMRSGVESLNVATAAALVAYEAMRQRERGGS